MRTLYVLSVLSVMIGGIQAHATSVAIYDFSGGWLRGPDSVVPASTRQRFSGTLTYPVDPAGLNGTGSIITLDLFDDQSNVSTFGNDATLFASVFRDSGDTFFAIVGGVDISEPGTENVFVDLPIEAFLSVQIGSIALTFEDETGQLGFTRTPPDEIVFSDFGNFGSLRLTVFGDREFLVGFVDTFTLREDPMPIPLPAGLPLLGLSLAALYGLGRNRHRRRQPDRRS